MRADELMIGDWVLDTFGNPIQVKELLEDGVNGEWEEMLGTLHTICFGAITSRIT